MLDGELLRPDRDADLAEVVVGDRRSHIRRDAAIDQSASGAGCRQAIAAPLLRRGAPDRRRIWAR